MKTNSGKLYLIGAGPGDPELLTVKAVKALAVCDVVLYDRLVGPAILSLAKPGAELIYVGKHDGEQQREQQRIADLILEHAAKGRSIARLKGGDPLVFGRGAEEWAVAAEHGIQVELIPGITSAIATPGLAGIPLTLRDVSRSFAVITGHHCHGPSDEWAKYANVDTLVVLMGVRNRAMIAQGLIAAGRNPNEPAAFIEKGSSASERVIETVLQAVANGEVEVENPAVFVIGEVVRFRNSLQTSR